MRFSSHLQTRSYQKRYMVDPGGRGRGYYLWLRGKKRMENGERLVRRPPTGRRSGQRSCTIKKLIIYWDTRETVLHDGQDVLTEFPFTVFV